MDAEGPAEDPLTAAGIFTNQGRDISAIIALGANSAVEPLEPEIVYETTPGVDRREFFQRYMPSDEPSLTSRFVDTQATAKLVDAIAQCSERHRLIRSISQYYEALRNWRMGLELLALAHLFMGVEAVKKASWRRLIATRGISKEDLAAEWGYSSDGRRGLDDYLDTEARLRLIFQGDDTCHRAAKRTSDHFEHGFSSAGKLYKGAEESLVATAAYLREAILSILDVSDDVRELLLVTKFKKPRGPLGLDFYLKSHLVGKGEKLEADGTEYPYCVWRSGLADVTLDEENQMYSFRPNNTLTASLAEGIKLENLRWELWDRSRFYPSDKEASATTEVEAK
jgi:hypothetical protein